MNEYTTNQKQNVKLGEGHFLGFNYKLPLERVINVLYVDSFRPNHVLSLDDIPIFRVIIHDIFYTISLYQKSRYTNLQ